MRSLEPFEHSSYTEHTPATPERRINDTLQTLGVRDSVPDELFGFICDRALDIERREARHLPGVVYDVFDEAILKATRGKIDRYGFCEPIGSKKHGFIVEQPLEEPHTSDDSFLDLGSQAWRKNELRVANVHFAPRIKGSRGLKIYDGTKNRTADTAEEKQDIMLRGMEGVMTYITLVEAGYIQAPDVLFNVTNPAMARAAERMGLKRLSTWKKESNERWGYKAHDIIPGDESIVRNSYGNFRDTALELFASSYRKLSERNAALKMRKTGKQVLRQS